MKYLFKIWLFTGIIGSVLFNLYYIFESEEVFHFNSYVDGEGAVILDLNYFVSLFFSGMILGLILTLPTLIILFLIKKYWINSKIVFIVIAIISIFVSIYVFGYNYFKEGLFIFPVIFSVVISFFIWKLREKP